MIIDRCMYHNPRFHTTYLAFRYFTEEISTAEWRQQNEDRQRDRMIIDRELRGKFIKDFPIGGGRGRRGRG